MRQYQAGPVPRVISGSDALAGLGRFADRAAAGGVLLVVDEAVVATGYAERVEDALQIAAHRLRRHVVPAAEPTAASVDEAAGALRRLSALGAGHEGATVVVGVGGGSAMDTAKQASVVATGDAGVDHYALGAHPFPGRHPIVAVPTTAGTGAEVTRTCVLTDPAGRKVWTWGDALLPDLVVLDPVGCATMPPHLTAATGLDAFVHAMEALSARRSNAISTSVGIGALRLVVAHLPDAVRHGDDLDARQAMQEAALLAGVAIDAAGTGMAHSIGHALGSLAHVPHGVAVAIGLAAALAWNVDGAPDAYAEAAHALGCAPAALADRYEELMESVGMADVVRRTAGPPVAPDALSSAMAAPENMPMVDNNARAADARDLRHLAERALRVRERWTP